MHGAGRAGGPWLRLPALGAPTCGALSTASATPWAMRPRTRMSGLRSRQRDAQGLSEVSHGQHKARGATRLGWPAWPGGLTRGKERHVRHALRAVCHART